MRAVSAHLVLSGTPSLAEAQVVAQAAKAAIAERFSITHATFELECEHCDDRDTNPCCLGERGTYRVSMGPETPRRTNHS